MIQVKEVRKAGLLSRISVTRNDVETHFHTVSKNEHPKILIKKRKELLNLAEFISLD